MSAERIFAIAATVISLTASAMKRNVQIFSLSAIANLLMGISYLLLGNAGSGMFMAFVAAAQCVLSTVYAYIDKKISLTPKIVFFLLYVACSVPNFKTAYDILPFVAAMLSMMAMFQKKPQRVRMFCVLNSAAWIAYDVVVGATALYSHILYMIVNIVAIIMYLPKTGKTLEKHVND